MVGVLSVIDSNGILRIVTGDLPDQAKKSLAWLSRQPPGSVTLLDAVLVEVLFQLESKSGYALNRSDFVSGLFRLFTTPQWSVSQLTREALGIFKETHLDYTDCLLLAMVRSGAVEEVFTFDKQLSKLTARR